MQNDKTPHRGIYLLPNLLTTAGLFAGFYAIVAAMNGQFSIAALAIMIAMIADGLDGRVARLTNTQTEFGVQYDSLSDLVAFGVAPALVVYHWSLMSLGKPGWLAAFLFTAMTVLRLARFNVLADTADKRYFQGLPCPSAAGVLATTVWVGNELAVLQTAIVSWILASLTLILALLMVSSIRYYSFKEVDFKGKVPVFAVLIVVLFYVVVSYDPPAVLFTGFALYAISGPVLTGYLLWRCRRKKRAGAQS
jgi:CDP-diacylglycerol---serine O-phosphatidyltransferase